MIIKKKAVLYAIVAPIILGVLFLAPKVGAAAEVLTITPTTATPVINPGATYSGNFQVIDQGNTSYPIEIYAAPYSVKTEAYTPDFTPVPGQPNVVNWIRFSSTQSTIQPNQAITVTYTISVPKTTQPGGYYAVAFAQTHSSQSAAGVVINERVGEIFYIQVAGPVLKSGKLLTWSTALFQVPPIISTIRLEDDGGLNYASNIQVVVGDIFGTPKYTLTTQKEILPHTIRRITINWAQTPSLGLFKVNGSVTVLGKTELLPSQYVLVMSSTARSASLIIVIIIVALIIFVYLAKRTRRSKYSKLNTKK